MSGLDGGCCSLQEVHGAVRVSSAGTGLGARRVGDAEIGKHSPGLLPQADRLSERNHNMSPGGRSEEASSSREPVAKQVSTTQNSSVKDSLPPRVGQFPWPSGSPAGFLHGL